MRTLIISSLLLRGALVCAEPATYLGEASDWVPPWHESAVPLPSGVISIEVSDHDSPLWLRPGAGKRGATNGGSRFMVLGSTEPGRGCSERWVLVGAEAWLCGAQGKWSTQSSNPIRIRATSSGLPYAYYFVGSEGTFGYLSLTLAGEGIPDSQLEPGFAIAATRFAERWGERFAHTTNGLWLPVRDLVQAQPSSFRGLHVESQATTFPDLVWVVSDLKTARNAPGGAMVRQLPRLTELKLTGREAHAGVEWLRTEQGDWVKASDVTARTVGPLPQDLRFNERWIDIDLSSQVLTAFEGERAVFATLVSTGRGSAGSATATPRGEHRVWVKLAYTDMTNLEDQAADHFYAMEAVPWVMFFKGGYGLHGAFWHDAFGTERSQGCVNLSPRDAAFLFEWTSPSLPAGWHAVHPTEFEVGTRIRIR